MSFFGKGASWKRMMGSGVPGATLMACSSRKAATSSGAGLEVVAGEGVAGRGVVGGILVPAGRLARRLLGGSLGRLRRRRPPRNQPRQPPPARCARRPPPHPPSPNPRPLRFFTGRPSLAAMNSSARFAPRRPRAAWRPFFAFFTPASAAHGDGARATAAPSGSRADPKSTPPLARSSGRWLGGLSAISSAQSAPAAERSQNQVDNQSRVIGG